MQHFTHEWTTLRTPTLDGTAWDGLSRSIFSHLLFYQAWAQSGLGHDAEVLVVYKDRRPVLILPLELSRHFGFRVATIAGDDHFPEIVLLADAQHQEPALSYAAEIVRKERGAVSLILKRQRISGSYPSSAFMQRAETLKVISTQKSWPDYVSSKSKRFRQEARQIEKLLEQEHLGIEVISARIGLLQALPELTQISSESWQGQAKSGTFSEAPVHDFYVALGSELADRNALRLTVLRQKNRAVAFLLCALEPTGTIQALKCEFSSMFANLKPGGVLFSELIQFAFASHYREIDTGVHFTEFKRRWSTDFPELWRVEVFSSSLLSIARRLFVRILANVKKLRKSKAL